MNPSAGNDTKMVQNGTLSEAKPPNRRVLDTLPTGTRLTGAQAAARSTMIRRLRIALPIVAFLLIGAFFFNTRSDGVDDAFLKDFKNVEAIPENLSMGNPRFTGIDTRGNPFDITAVEATRNPDQEDYVTLDRPRAVTNGDGKQSIVFADKGGYATETRILKLEDNVTLDHLIGGEKYVLTTPAATVTVEDQLVVSDAGVYGTGPRGTNLKADQMNAYNDEGRVVFKGNVSMRIYPSKEFNTNDAPELRDGTVTPPGDSE